MRNLLIIFFICKMSLFCFSQDIIVTQDGSLIESKVIEVNKTDIKYKKFSNLNGPIYVTHKNDILSIKYENGEIEKFKKNNDELKQEEGNKIIKGLLDDEIEDNKIIIDQFCSSSISLICKTGKNARTRISQVVPHKSSQLFTKDINIDLGIHNWHYNGGITHTCESSFLLSIHNNSDRIVYIDLGSSLFRYWDDTKCLYDNTTITDTKGGNTGLGISLGVVADVLGVNGVVGDLADGVTVGGTKNSSVSKTIQNPRVVAIAPGAKYWVPDMKFQDTWFATKVKGLKVGDTKTFKEPTSIKECQFSYIIIYATEPDFKSSRQLEIGLYVNKTIGTPRLKEYSDLNKYLECSAEAMYYYERVSTK